MAAYSPYGVPLDLESPYDPTPVVTDAAAAVGTAINSSSQYTSTLSDASGAVGVGAADVAVPAAVAVGASAMSVLNELDRDYQTLRQRLLTALVAIEQQQRQQQQGQAVPVQSISHTPLSSSPPPSPHTASTPTPPSPYAADLSTLNTFLDDDDFLTAPTTSLNTASATLTVDHTKNNTTYISPSSTATAPAVMTAATDDETTLPLPSAPRSYWPPTTAAAMRRTGDSYLTNTDPTIPTALLQDEDERTNALLSTNNKTNNKIVSSNSIIGHSIDVTTSSASVGGAQQQVTAKRKRYWPPSI